MAESEALPGASRIRASIEKLIGRVSAKGRISVNTNKWQNPRHYQDLVESCEYRKIDRFGIEKGQNLGDYWEYRKTNRSGIENG